MSLIRPYTFDSKFKIVGKFKTDFGEEAILNEQMFRKASMDFAYQNGGEIMKNFLDSLPQEWKNSQALIDTTVHSLKKGWWPSKPGWHHDGIKRSRISDQPIYTDDQSLYFADYLCGLVNAPIAPTEFFSGNITLSPPDYTKVIYWEWGKEIDQYLEKHNREPFKASSGVMIQYDSHTFHRSTAAQSDGPRWFVRLYRFVAHDKEPLNLKVKNSQIYLPFMH